MSVQDQISIHSSVLARFHQLIKRNRLAHAYLFVGPPLVGKTETALAVAKLANCLNNTSGNFCGACGSCVKINKGNHPDVHIVEGEDNGTIKIEQIRELLSQIQLRPFEALKKVFIIKNAENLTPEAGNALLKTLEEPSLNSLLLLTTTGIEKNMDTIVSRCHVIHFFPASKDKLEASLKKYYDVESPRAHFLASFAQGCLGQAKKLIEGKMFERKNQLIDGFIMAPTAEDFIKKVTADKDETRELLSILLSWVHDTLLMKAGAEQNRLIHADRLKELNTFQQQRSFEELQELYDEIVKASRLLDENLNVKIPLMLIREKLNYGKNN